MHHIETFYCSLAVGMALLGMTSCSSCSHYLVFAYFLQRLGACLQVLHHGLLRKPQTT